MPREYILVAARSLPVHAPRQVPGTASSSRSHSTLDNIARVVVRTQPSMRSADHRSPGSTAACRSATMLTLAVERRPRMFPSPALTDRCSGRRLPYAASSSSPTGRPRNEAHWMLPPVRGDVPVGATCREASRNRGEATPRLTHYAGHQALWCGFVAIRVDRAEHGVRGMRGETASRIGRFRTVPGNPGIVGNRREPGPRPPVLADFVPDNPASIKLR